MLRFVVVLGLLAMAPAVMADATGGGTLPWSGPLEIISNSLTGEIAFYVALFALVASFSALMFGGEMNDLVKRLIQVVLVISVLVGASGFLRGLFGVGELLPEEMVATEAPRHVARHADS